MPKRIMVNNDGHGVFSEGYDSREAIEESQEVYRGTYVAVLGWCISIGTRANYPSKFTEILGEDVTEFPRKCDRQISETLHRLIASGVDPLKVVINKGHEIGIRVFPSMRMNPDYNLGWMGEGFAKMYNSRFWWENPHLRIKDRRGNPKIHLSYAYPEVRKWKLSILRELMNYDLDGLNLDFVRHPPFFGYDDPLVEGFKKDYGQSPPNLAEDDRWLRHRAAVMTDFLRQVRHKLDKLEKGRGKRLEISARVDHRHYLHHGLDIETWIREGLLNKLVVSEHGSLGGFLFSLKPFREMVKGTPCELYFGEEVVCSGHDLTPQEDQLLAQGKLTKETIARRKLSTEEYCKRALQWYSEGADGVHIFNDHHNREVFEILGEPGKIKEFLKRTN